MSPEEVKALLARPALPLAQSSPGASYVTTTSWLGRVYLSRPGETVPLDAQGRPMRPLLQLVLAGWPWAPAALAGTQALTVFVSQQLPVDTRRAPNGQNWLLREYPLGEPLLMNKLTAADSPLRPFPLQAGPVPTDHPVWDDGGISEGLAEQLVALARAGVIEEDYAWLPNHDGHKLGGWPSFCQSGSTLSPGFEFVLQIASDDNARFTVVDGGTIFPAKHTATKAWEFCCDFY